MGSPIPLSPVKQANISTYITHGGQYNFCCAPLYNNPDADFVIAWMDNSSRSWARRFKESDGSSPDPAEFEITPALSERTDDSPAYLRDITGLNDGGFAASFFVHSYIQYLGVKRFNASGAAAGWVVPAIGTVVGQFVGRVITRGLTNGNYVSFHSYGGFSRTIYNGSDTLVASDEIYGSGGIGQYVTHACALTGGGFVAMTNDTPSDRQVHVTTFNSAGSVVGVYDMPLGTTTLFVGGGVFPKTGGGFTAVWNDNNFNDTIYWQEFSALGVPIGSAYNFPRPTLSFGSGTVGYFGAALRNGEVVYPTLNTTGNPGYYAAAKRSTSNVAQPLRAGGLFTGGTYTVPGSGRFQIEPLPSGNFVTYWTSSLSPSPPTSVYFQLWFVDRPTNPGNVRVMWIN